MPPEMAPATPLASGDARFFFAGGAGAADDGAVIALRHRSSRLSRRVANLCTRASMQRHAANILY